ncbi:MAG: UDP-3-O-(3-hydroxymyristoyl)glucosamine N-acyltransferase [Minwuia sp.]|nr:UDP-3-O-(3-hydroxymyristoyl)glucosamine N-acyltransferase [Minwuia sp.]
MPDSRFHPRQGPFALGELAQQTGLFEVPDGIDPALSVQDALPLEQAGKGCLSFLDNRKYLPALETTSAEFCVISPDLADRVPEGTVALPTPHPYLAFAMISQALYPGTAPVSQVHATAVVGDDVVLGADLDIGAHVVIGARAEIGDGAVLGPNVSVGPGVVIGAGCRIDANASLETCILGQRVHVQSGARIGPGGFGFAPHPQRHVAVPQVGRVLIGNDCHIGANVCVARGSGHDTVIGNNVWIDNLVQIAHNVKIGDGSIIVAQVGIAGSSKLGQFVQVGGQAGVSGHVKVGNGVKIGALSGVMNDQPDGAVVLGQPAIPVRDFWRQLAAIRRLTTKKGTDR